MRQALRFAFQLLLYVPLMALIGYFSASPRLQVVAPGEALLRLSFTHAAQRKQECRQRSAEELARLAPNMRAALDCPRERASLIVELELDGRQVLRRIVPPAGLKRDGAATLYHRLPIAAGAHRIAVRLSDRAAGDFNYTREATLQLAPGAALVIDFAPGQGVFIFRS